MPHHSSHRVAPIPQMAQEDCSGQESKVSPSDLPTQFLIESCTRTVASLRNEISKQLNQDQEILLHRHPEDKDIQHGSSNVEAEEAVVHQESSTAEGSTQTGQSPMLTTAHSLNNKAEGPQRAMRPVSSLTTQPRDALLDCSGSKRVSVSRPQPNEQHLQPSMSLKHAKAPVKDCAITCKEDKNCVGKLLHVQRKASSTAKSLRKPAARAKARKGASVKCTRKTPCSCARKTSIKSKSGYCDDMRNRTFPVEALGSYEKSRAELSGGRSPPLHNATRPVSPKFRSTATTKDDIVDSSLNETTEDRAVLMHNEDSDEQQELQRLIASLPYSFRERVQQSVSRQRSVPVVPDRNRENSTQQKQSGKPKGVPNQLRVFHRTAINKHVDRCRKARERARDRTTRSNGRNGKSWTGKPTVPQPFRLRTSKQRVQRTPKECPAGKISILQVCNGDGSVCECETSSTALGRSCGTTESKEDEWKDRVLHEIQQLQQCVHGLSKQQQGGALAVPLRHTRHRKVTIDVDDVESNTDVESTLCYDNPETKEDPVDPHIFKTPDEIDEYVKQAIRYE